MVRDLLALHFGISTQEVGHIEVAPELDVAPAEEVTQTRQAREQAEKASAQATMQTRRAAELYDLPGPSPWPHRRTARRQACDSPDRHGLEISSIKWPMVPEEHRCLPAGVQIVVAAGRTEPQSGRRFRPTRSAAPLPGRSGDHDNLLAG